MIKQILSYLGGYYNSKIFNLDIINMTDISEMSDEEFINELNSLNDSKDIIFKDNVITLITIKPVVNKNFNNTYKKVETFEWKAGSSLKLDKNTF